MGFSDNTPVRRSTRRRKVPVSYAVPEEDQMEDIKPTLLPAQHQQEQQLKKTLTCHSNVVAKLESQPTATRTCITTEGAPSDSAGGSPRPYSKLQEAESSDDSDGEYGVKHKRKKPKTAHLHKRILVGNAEDKEEQILRRICSSLGIDLSLFDDWVEDPRLEDVSKMDIPFMPNEIMMEIFGHCRSEVLVQCERSCQRFRDLLKGNTRIWCKARVLHYPGLNFDPLPYNLDEFSLFELATEKKCDYCESGKTRPYYAWSIRSCHECIKSLTMSISEFRKMFKKKCDDEEDWTPYRREQVCNAIHWHRNPNYSKISWKEYVYNLIEDAEDEMLAGTFDSWIKTKQISRRGRETQMLEEWGSNISREIDADRREDEKMVRKLRKSCYHDWCMRLPRPIPIKTLNHTKAYEAFCRISSYPTRSEFIRQLPKLLAERDSYEEKERKKEELKALYRIQQDSVLDRACSDIIQQVIEEGPLSPLSWCTILQKALQKVGKTRVEIKIPRGTPLAVSMRPGDWRRDWNSNDLMRLIDILEERLYLHPNTSASESHLHPTSHGFFNNGEDRVFGCPAALQPCKREDVMDFRELISHILSHNIDLQHYRYIWTNPHNLVVVHPAIKQNRTITIINGRKYWQKKLQLWFRPLPEMTESDCSASWGNSRYSGVFKTIMKQREKSGCLDMTDSGNGTPAVGAGELLKGWAIERNGLRDENRSVSHKSIMAYFHVQKRPAVKT